MKTYLQLLSFVMLAACACEATIDRIYVYSLNFDNQSSYDITLYFYTSSGLNPSYLLSSFSFSPNPIIKSGEWGGGAIYPWRSKDGPPATDIIPYCEYGRYHDSLRVYFNEGKPDQRYITYYAGEFKPRDIRNPKEYRFEPVDTYEANFYYIFTNQDYENAEKHDQATPTPIPEEELRCLY